LKSTIKKRSFSEISSKKIGVLINPSDALHRRVINMKFFLFSFIKKRKLQHSVCLSFNDIGFFMSGFKEREVEISNS
jgi:hypothetical protein